MAEGIIAVVDDLFFAAKIKGAAEALGVALRIAKDVDSALERSAEEKPRLFIIDLQSVRFDPFALIERLKSDAALRDVPALGFFSHVQVGLARRAKSAGCDLVLPRSVFVKSLPAILSGELPSSENASGF